MNAKEDTKEKILAMGARIIHRKGFHHTGIQEILKAAGVPKGSFYFYFDNKEDFGLQVIDWYSRNFREMLTKLLAQDNQLSPLQRMSALFDWFMEFYQDLEFTCGCPVGNLAQEMGDLSPAFSEKLSQAVGQMVDMYRQLIEAAQSKGELSGELEAEETARFIVSSWHGALIHMKISKGAGPLKNHKKTIFEKILGVKA